MLRSEARELYDALVSGDALPALVVSAVAGAGTLALVWLRRYEAARYSAAIAVAAIVAGWALAQQPVLLPGLTVSEAAAGARRARRGAGVGGGRRAACWRRRWRCCSR